MGSGGGGAARVAMIGDPRFRLWRTEEDEFGHGFALRCRPADVEEARRTLFRRSSVIFVQPIAFESDAVVLELEACPPS